MDSEVKSKTTSKCKVNKKQSKNPLLRRLPSSIEALSERIGLRKVPEDYIKTFIKEVLPRSSYTVDEFKEYAFNFDKFKRRKIAVKQKKRKTLLNANEQRKLAVFKLDPSTTKFQTFLPVHELWKKYMQNLLQLKENLPDDLSNIYQKLFRADYHGCMIVVASSHCSSYVGLRGIVVQETRNVFKLITEENKIKNPLLRCLPSSIEALSERIGLRKVPEDYIKTFIKEVLPRSSYTVDEFNEYAFNFDKFKRRKIAVKQKKRKTLLNANEQRKLAVFKLDPSTTKFQTFLPVHELWKKYMQNLLQLKANLPDDLSNIYQKLFRADYHGCMIVVASSHCSSYVGLRGIVVQETRNVFKLITEENKIKTVPKKGSVFCFELCGQIIKIYGDNFKFVPYERARIKYKTKSVVDP